MGTIKKAVVPVAGLGTRFLPVTKTIPKELLPIVDKPILLYIAEEIMAAGIEQLVLVSGRGKGAIEDFFDISYELEDTLEKTGKGDMLKALREIRRNLNVVSVRQQQALGLGHAVLCARPALGNEPFALLLGDEIMITPPGHATAIAQLCRIYQERQTSVVAVMEVPEADVSKYGIVQTDSDRGGMWKVKSVIEKPAVGQAPSRLALPGRYVFDPEILNCLEGVRPGRNGEIQLTDGMTLLAQRRGMLATTVEATRYDAGDKLGFLIANIELGLQHPEMGVSLNQYLRARFGGK